MFDRILVANDGSAGGEKALSAALELAKRLGVELSMVSVEETPRFPATIDEIEEDRAAAAGLFDKAHAKAKAEARAMGVRLETHIVAGHPVPAIAEFVRDGRYDLLVVGFMGHSQLYNRLIGGATDRLVEIAPCKVLVVK